MGFLQKVVSIPRHLPTGNLPDRGFKAFAVDKGERIVMGAALGAAKGYYRERLVFKGVDIEAIVGVVGTLGAALFHTSKLSPHLERAGDTGLTTYAYACGAAWGGDKAGHGVAVAKVRGIGADRVVGVIPPRASGAFLTADEMANYSSPR